MVFSPHDDDGKILTYREVTDGSKNCRSGEPMDRREREGGSRFAQGELSVESTEHSIPISTFCI